MKKIIVLSLISIIIFSGCGENVKNEKAKIDNKSSNDLSSYAPFDIQNTPEQTAVTTTAPSTTTKSAVTTTVPITTENIDSSSTSNSESIESKLQKHLNTPEYEIKKIEGTEKTLEDGTKSSQTNALVYKLNDICSIKGNNFTYSIIEVKKINKPNINLNSINNYTIFYKIKIEMTSKYQSVSFYGHYNRIVINSLNESCLNISNTLINTIMNPNQLYTHEFIIGSNKNYLSESNFLFYITYVKQSVIKSRTSLFNINKTDII